MTTHKSKTLVDAWLSRETSRRSLLKHALLATGAAVAASAVPGPLLAGDGDASRALVGAGTGSSPTDAMDAALKLAGGLDFIDRGDTVYFKVNSNSGDPWPHSTSAELIVALAQRCRDHGATRIIVGDRSFWGDGDTLGNLEANGIADAARSAEADLYAFEDDNVDWVQVSEDDVPDWNGGFRLPKPVVEADHIINMPCVKTHFIAHFTLALKNSFGLIHPADRKRKGNLRHHDTESGRLWRQIAQANAVFTPSLNVLDGYRALITGGPNAGRGYGAAEATYADPEVVFVSRDRVAIDAVGVGLLQTLSPESEAVTQAATWAQPQLAAAVKLGGLGITGPGELTIAGDVPSLDTIRERATAT